MPKQHQAAQSFESDARPPIALTPVESKQVHSVGYDKDTATLAVTFRRWDGRAPDAVYHYPDVSPVMHAEFIGAESVGKYFGEHIRALPFKKFRADPVEATEGADAAAA